MSKIRVIFLNLIKLGVHGKNQTIILSVDRPPVEVR